MSDIVEDTEDWQKRFYAQPRVWIVTDRDGVIEGIYETEGAALLCVTWHQKQNHLVRMHDEPICSLQLAMERWGTDVGTKVPR